MVQTKLPSMENVAHVHLVAEKHEGRPYVHTIQCDELYGYVEIAIANTGQNPRYPEDKVWHIFVVTSSDGCERPPEEHGDYSVEYLHPSEYVVETEITEIVQDLNDGEGKQKILILLLTIEHIDPDIAHVQRGFILDKAKMEFA